MKRTNTAVWMEKQNRWQINVQKDGVRRSFYSSTPGRNGQREANRKADAWLDDGVETTKKTVEQMFPLYVESLLSEQAKEDAEKFGRLYIIPAIGRRKIANLIEDDFQSILDKGAKLGANGKPLSHKYLDKIRHTMIQFVKFCRRKKMTTLILEDLVVPKGAAKGKKRIVQPNGLVTLFTSDQVKMYGKSVRDDYINAYRFAVLTGVRPGELMGIRPEDVVPGAVLLKRSINEDGIVTTGKNENALRRVILSPIAQDIIQEQMQLELPYVFGINSQSTYRHRWKRYCESNGIPYVSPYELRHTFVSSAKGLSDGEMKSLVGHSKNMDTWGVYGNKEIEGERDRISAKLQTIFEEILTTQK